MSASAVASADPPAASAAPIPGPAPTPSILPALASPIELSGDTTKQLDAACNAWDGIPLALFLRSKGTNPIDLDLRTSPLEPETKGAVADAQVKLAGAGGNPLPRPLQLTTDLPLTVTIKGALGAGKWKFSLLNHDIPIGQVTLEVPGLPLTVKISGNPPESESLTLTRDEQATIVLENPDPVGHDLAWELNLGRGSPARGEVRLPAGGRALLNFVPTPGWFGPYSPCILGSTDGSHLCIPRNIGSLFKDEERAAFLILSDHATDCPQSSGAPGEAFRLKTTLASYGPARKAFWSYAVLLALLLVGALFSLYVNFKFPDERIRRDLRRSLAVIGRAIENLSMRLSSKLRIPVGVEQHALLARLRALRWYSSEFDVNRADIMAQTDRLRRRVDLLERNWQLREDLWRLRKRKVPPTLLSRAEDLFQLIDKLLNAAQTTEAELQSVDTKLTEVAGLFTGWSQPNETLAAQVFASLNDLNADINSGGQLDSSPTAAVLKKEVGSLVKDLSTKPPSVPIAPADYYELDSLAMRGCLFRDYCLATDAKGGVLKLSTAQQSAQAKLLVLLQDSSWNAIRQARLLVNQAAEGFYSDDVRKDLLDGLVEIRVDRNQLLLLEPANFLLKFKRAVMDSATACQEWSFRWTFEPLNQTVLRETASISDTPDKSAPAGGQPVGLFTEEDGRSVAHFFSSPGRYTVRVGFRHEETGDLLAPDGKPLTVERTVSVANPRAIVGRFKFLRWLFGRPYALVQENLNEVVRLIIALVPAVLGLVAGAKDQLLKMDLFVALISTFLAGFGSDQVKNLLAPKPK